MLPIIKKDSGYTLTDEETQFLSRIEYNYVPANNNFLSKDYYILENKSMSGLRNIITDFVDEYRREVCGMEQEIFITQSWIARTLVGGFHSRHNHPNSLFSGVFYIDCSDNSPLNFYYDNLLFKNFKFDVDFYRETEYNRNMTSVNITPNQMVMFPSWAEHDVGFNLGPRERVVLAFNTFVRGDFGFNNFYPTGLKIN